MPVLQHEEAFHSVAIDGAEAPVRVVFRPIDNVGGMYASNPGSDRNPAPLNLRRPPQQIRQLAEPVPINHEPDELISLAIYLHRQDEVNYPSSALLLK